MLQSPNRWAFGLFTQALWLQRGAGGTEWRGPTRGALSTTGQPIIRRYRGSPVDPALLHHSLGYGSPSQMKTGWLLKLLCALCNVLSTVVMPFLEHVVGMQPFSVKNKHYIWKQFQRHVTNKLVLLQVFFFHLVKYFHLTLNFFLPLFTCWNRNVISLQIKLQLFILLECRSQFW